jgi:hypothetical protein
MSWPTYGPKADMAMFGAERSPVLLILSRLGHAVPLRINIDSHTID